MAYGLETNYLYAARTEKSPEEMCNPTKQDDLCKERVKFNPLKMTEKLTREAGIYLEETKIDPPTEKKDPAEERRLWEGVYFTGTESQEKDQRTIVTALAGNPLIIALYLKQYDKAEKILEIMPWTAGLTYAVVPIDVVMQEEQFIGNNIYSSKGIYIERLLLTDREIPESLFLRIMRRILEDHGNIPSYLSRTREVMEFNSRELERLADKIKETPSEQYDLECHRDMVLQYKQSLRFIKGFERLKRLDPELFEKYMDERAAAYLFVAIGHYFDAYKQHMVYMAFRGSGKYIVKHSKPGMLLHFEDEAGKLAEAFKSIGIESISADDIWHSLLEYDGTEAFNYVVRSGYRFYFALWKEVFKEKLIFNPEANKESGKMLLNTLFDYDEFIRRKDLRYSSLPSSSKNFVTLVDEMKWDSREYLKKWRRQIERLVVESGDKEFFIICLEKNIFPKWDAGYLCSIVWKGHSDMLRPVILKLHGYI